MKTSLLKLFFTAFLVGNMAIAMATTSNHTLSYRDDPATTIVVGWSGDDGTVYYGTTNNGQNYMSYANNKATDRQATVKGQNRKFARLTGLTPNTVYYFVVHDNAGQTSQVFKFQTLSDNPNDPVSFISGGDTRQGVWPVENCNCRTERQEGNQLVAKLRPDFVAFNGDFIRNTPLVSDDAQEWTDWFADWSLATSGDGRLTPIIMTQGNHEDGDDMYNLFDIPQDEYYALDIHGGLIRMYSLNSELNACSDAAQLNWFDTDLQNHSGTGNDPIYKIAQYHIPTLALGNSYGLQSDQMDCWVPLFEQYGVNLVLESHTHITKWTYPVVKNGAGTDFELDPNGIVYIGEGQWGAPHRALDFSMNPGDGNYEEWIRDQDVFDNFFFITADQNGMCIQTVRFDNVAGVATLFDDDLGSALPSGVSLWTPANTPTGCLEIAGPGAPSNIDEQVSNVSQIYPVPASDQVTVEFVKVYDQEVTIEIYNSLGKLCRTETVSGTNQVNVDVTELCSGVNYFYIKTPDGKVESHRIVKVD